MQLNAGGYSVVEELVARAQSLGVTVGAAPCGAQIVDCGVASRGSAEAGVLMARAALANLGTVRVERPGPSPAAEPLWPGCDRPVVAVATSAPLAACLAAQYAGWKVKAPGYFAMASGPIRAAIGREDLFDHIGMRERAEHAVGLLETASLPPDEVCRSLATAAGVPPERLVILVARTSSIAGTVQVVARSLETALHKLHDLKFDLRRIRRGSGRAPLPPADGVDDLRAIGLTNDAILYGGHVILEVAGDDDDLVALGPRMVSSASAAYGLPFATLFERAGGDFYALDPALFAPAVVELINVDTGRHHRFGRLAPEILQTSFAAFPAAARRT